MTTPTPATGEHATPAEAPAQEPEVPESSSEPDWRSHARTWESRAKKNRSELDAAQARIKELEEVTATESEKALRRARDEAAAEVEQTWRTRWEGERRNAVAERMLSRATRNPGLLLPHLALADIAVADDGEVDEGALAAAIDQLLDRYPDMKLDAAPSTSYDIGRKPSPPRGPGGSLESGRALYERRHGKAG